MTQFKLNERIKKLIDEDSLTVAKVQRRLEVGYALASSIIDALSEEGLLLEFDRKVKIIKKGKEEQAYSIITKILKDNQNVVELVGGCSGNAETVAEFSNYYDFDIYKKLLPNIVKKGWVNADYVQKAFLVGYPRAARIIDFLLEAEVVKRVESKIICNIEEKDIDEAFNKIIKLYK